MSVWLQMTRANRSKSLNFSLLLQRRGCHVVRAHFRAFVETVRRLSALRASLVLGYLRSSEKMKAKHYFFIWTFAARSRANRRFQQQHILNRLEKRLGCSALCRGWEAWRKCIVLRSKCVSTAGCDSNMQSLSDEDSAAKDDVCHLNMALLHRQRFGRSLLMLSQAKDRLRVVKPLFYQWRKNTGTWIPRDALVKALACKAIMTISPVLPDLQRTSGMASVAKLQHLRAMKDAMDRWEWMLRWARTKRHLFRRMCDSTLHVCWKVWCLMVSQSHLFRHAVLKIISWTSMRSKSMCFRAWAVKCRHSVSQKERSLWNKDDVSWIRGDGTFVQEDTYREIVDELAARAETDAGTQQS